MGRIVQLFLVSVFYYSIFSNLLFPQSIMAINETGKGVKVALIDSGIDGTHPFLKGKKLHGYDFITKSKKLIDLHGHGTFMAGIVLQKAPDAEIYSYRVLNAKGEEENENNLTRAVKEAVEKKVDIINISLNSEIERKSDGEFKKWINKAIQNGVIVVVSAGNSCSHDKSILFPGTLSDVITVGASERGTMPVMHLGESEVRLECSPLEDSPTLPLNEELSIVGVGEGRENKDYSDAKGKVVLVRRSDLSPYDISEMACRNGAKAVIIYNNRTGDWNGESSIRWMGVEFELPTAVVTRKSGTTIMRKLSDQLRVRFSTIEKEFVDSSSARGSVRNKLKPDIVAPGVNVKSCVPFVLDKRGYKEMSGTSQAAAYVTGVVALLKEKYPKWSVQEIKGALMGTATLLKNTLDQTVPFTDQGAGRIDIERALSTQAVVIPSSLSFGKVQVREDKTEVIKRVVIHNKSDRLKQYKLEGVCISGKRGLKIEVPKNVEISANSKQSLFVTLHLTKEKLRRHSHMGVIWVKEVGEEGGPELHMPVSVYTSVAVPVVSKEAT